MLAKLISRFDQTLVEFNSQSPIVGLGRSIIALSQIILLLFTPAEYLFVPVIGRGESPECERYIVSISAYCLGGSANLQLKSYLLILGLLVVASGFLPRYTSFLHFWISFSIGVAISLPDGGEAVAQIVTFLLCFVLINDRRVWHWKQEYPHHRLHTLNAVAWGGFLAVRLQLFYIYMSSAVEKSAKETWRDGSAIYYILRGELFGAEGWGKDFFLWLSSTPVGTLSMTWGTILLEGAAAIFILRSGKWPIITFIIALLLHSIFILLLGLWTFGLIMIGVVIIATSSAIEMLLQRKGLGKY